MTATVEEMAEAHLANVQREINNLNQRKAEIDAEIGRLATYLQEGQATLQEAKSTTQVVPNAPVNQGGATVFNPTQ